MYTSCKALFVGVTPHTSISISLKYTDLVYIQKTNNNIAYLYIVYNYSFCIFMQYFNLNKISHENRMF